MLAMSFQVQGLNVIHIALAVLFSLIMIIRYYKGILLYISGVSKRTGQNSPVGRNSLYKERRRAPRVDAGADGVVAKIIKGNIGEYLKVLNISRVGALLRSGYIHRVGETIEASLYFTSSFRPLDVKARVIRTARVYDREGLPCGFDVGVEFVHIFGNDNEKLSNTVKRLIRTEKKIPS